MDVWRSAAVLSQLQSRVLQDVIFSVQHRQLAADKQDAAVIIQRPDFIRRHQLSPGLLMVHAAGTAAPLGYTARPGIQRFLSQQFGDIFEGADLVAA